MLEVLQQDFVRTARAKGLPERLVTIWRHAFRNILVPLITSAGVILGGLLSNTVVVETIFNIPGLGRLAIDSIFARDYPVAMAVVDAVRAVLRGDQSRPTWSAPGIDPRLRRALAA